jgi:hypothetical protein
MENDFFIDEEQIIDSKYSLTCEICGNNLFSALPDGHIQCKACMLCYKYCQSVKDWIYTVADPEMFLKMAEKKVWSKKQQKFLDEKEVEKENNEKINELTHDEIEKLIDEAEKKLKNKKIRKNNNG